MMSTARYLTADEQVVLEVRRHISILLGPATPAVIAIIVAFLLSPPSGVDAISTVLWWLTVPFVLWLVWKWALWWVDRIVVTDQRIFETSGILIRKIGSMPLSKVTDLTYNRSVLGRLLGYGEIVLESAGQVQGLDHINYLPEPDNFYRTLLRLTLRPTGSGSGGSGSGSGGSGSGSGGSPMDDLERRYARGEIDREEFLRAREDLSRR